MQPRKDVRRFTCLVAGEREDRGCVCEWNGVECNFAAGERAEDFFLII